MVILEAIAVFGMAGVLVYATIMLLTRPPAAPADVSRAGEWRPAHFDVEGETHVVLRKISPGGDRVLDEHVIAAIPVADPDYDAKFLTAMSAARERRALFESEDDS